MKRAHVSIMAVVAFAPIALAQNVDLVGGQTSVLLDATALAGAAGLTISGVSPAVIVPGSIPGSVAFPINPRNASSLPTTFSYDASNFLGSFSGTIEHSGSVFFNANTVEVGNFTIGFDAARAGTLGGAASGFFVASTTGIAAILFDIENPSELVANTTNLTISADLLVSPEFGSFLLAGGLSSTNLAGADVGDARVEGVVPAPSVAAFGLFSGLAALRRRR